MQIPALNTNTILILILIGAGMYGPLAGKQRLRIFILSIYIGVVLAEQFTDAVGPMITMLGRDQVGWLLLGIPILIFGLFGTRHGKHDKGSFIANVIVGILAGALIISSALRLLPVSGLSAINRDSFIAMMLQQHHLWLLGGLPVVVLILGFMKGKIEKKH